jgi:hypothetical protein
MKFTNKQNKLLLTSSVSLIVIILLDIWIKQAFWLSALNFLPFIFFTILTLTTDQKIFRQKPHWNIFLSLIFIINVQLLNRALIFLLKAANLNSTVFSYAILIAILLTYLFFFWRNNKQRIQTLH